VAGRLVLTYPLYVYYSVMLLIQSNGSADTDLTIFWSDYHNS